jgi:putative phosphoribosyl transferase
MPQHETFRDRADAGRQLARCLHDYAGADAVVLGLARGGVPVALEVARALDAELDVFVVRKLGVPGREELALGAIASGGARVLNDEVIDAVGIDAAAVDAIVAREQREIDRREQLYRNGRPAVSVTGRSVVLVDDGLATGASMRAAAVALKARDAAEIVVAVPVAPPETCAEFEDYVDRTVCARTPELFSAVGAWYDDFAQVSDEEVRELLAA